MWPTIPILSRKLCPLTLDDLQPGPTTPGVSDEFYEACKKVITSRAAYQAIFNSIPLSNTPSFTAFLDRYANLSDGSELTSFESDLESKIKAAYSSAKKEQVEDPSPYKAIRSTLGKAFGIGLSADFRYKLSALEAGDTIYYVEGETKDGRRYRIGEIVLDSVPFPSLFADKEFFIQHDMEMNRMPGQDQAIVEP